MAHPARLRSFEYVGFWRYLATTCTYKRRPRFRGASTVTSSLDQILQASAQEKCEVLAYCFMPDHVHLLIAGADAEADFERFMKLAKQRSGWRHSRDTGQRLWRLGYHERVLRTDEATPDVIRYMVANPVQAGLVARAEDYPFWGSATYSRDEIPEFIANTRQT
jgi:putative transposase